VIQYAVIRSGSGKDVAVVVHDTLAKRVVFKGAPEGDLYDAFADAYNRAVVIPISVGGAMYRRKVLPSQEEYLRALLDKFVHSPYEVRLIQPADEGMRIDSVADKLAGELLE